MSFLFFCLLLVFPFCSSYLPFFLSVLSVLFMFFLLFYSFHFYRFFSFLPFPLCLSFLRLTDPDRHQLQALAQKENRLFVNVPKKSKCKSQKRTQSILFLSQKGVKSASLRHLSHVLRAQGHLRNLLFHSPGDVIGTCKLWITHSMCVFLFATFLCLSPQILGLVRGEHSIRFLLNDDKTDVFFRFLKL